MLLTYARLGSWRWVLLGLTLLVTLYLLLPIVFIVALSFGSSQWMIFPPPGWTLRWYEALAEDPRWLETALTSLEVGVLVAALSVALGLAAAFALVRGRFRGRQVLRLVFLTPMVLPVVIFAVAVYGFYLRLGLNGTLLGFVLAHTVLAFPFAVLTISNALAQFDPSIEDAAILCGASPLAAKWRVTLPNIRLGLISAAIFSFLISWDEVVVAIFMGSPTLQTLPVHIWGMLRQDLSPAVAAASSILVGITLVLMLVAALLTRKSKA
ncbi:ABC transporter permease [Zavarzinia sp.]|uniref:ABC transporter permease n=1 Tax=Zavarzinia sp. TaxID=2027920 RepID=UPI0035613616